MKYLRVILLFGIVAVLAGCAAQTSGEVLLEAVVAEYVPDTQPGALVFKRRVEGFKNASLVEGPDGTLFYSSDGCLLGGGGPVMSGAAVRIAGYADDGELIAETVWLLDIVLERGDCDGPPANQTDWIEDKR